MHSGKEKEKRKKKRKKKTYALHTVYQRFPQRCFWNSSSVCLTMDPSRPSKEDRLALPLSTPLFPGDRWCLWLQLCPHVCVSSSSTLQATCDGCFARHLSDRSFAFTPACQGKYTVPLFTDIDECVSAPCQNGGTCTDHVNRYLCQCAPGYSGLQCQTGKFTVSLKYVQDRTYLKCSYNYLKEKLFPVWFLSWRVEFSLIIWVVVMICIGLVVTSIKISFSHWSLKELAVSKEFCPTV